MAQSGPTILDVHTPSSSFAIIYSDPEDTLDTLNNKLSKKAATELRGGPVRPGCLKYEWNDTVWNLDDESDFSIFAWRMKSSTPVTVLHLRDPDQPLPRPSEYRNPSFYMFHPRSHPTSPQLPASPDSTSVKSGKSRRRSKDTAPKAEVPKFKEEFEKFHNENGVRTVIGSIGPVNNVRMLLKSGYRHVYISRKFAIKNGFIPRDAAPGYYGYSGLVNLGKWPITVGRTRTTHSVYLSEESHFDVVLGRSFVERRQIKFDPVDPTDVVCQDTGEKIDCELVILKDGKGQIVTVT
ncbi:hypothetical protein L226DRAFT_550369 [Lentinus tigrinus ALCF2SS1-7]|uniref:Uncharacterized protein n=1 Tax=Lentinus tigrinus ALCF2SS1-6 TaxID=1328759 RepID=A0A5C2SSI9_9APHY|nr:hypothetical protein L227DRAFT_143445 [Lentinus tigrinus ALCF2SS1-6]RPD80324.1 hypothetical protein L226DRAFT_550369 [Lentinus tigrinus ALCF2SS1-7]